MLAMMDAASEASMLRETEQFEELEQDEEALGMSCEWECSWEVLMLDSDDGCPGAS